MHNAFITGSHAYGLPDKHSDVDLCVLIDEQAEDLLYAQFTILTEALADCDYDGRGTIRIGKLNLIHFTDSLEFDAWRVVTEQLIWYSCWAGPVNKKVAAAAIDAEIAKRRRESNGKTNSGS